MERVLTIVALIITGPLVGIELGVAAVVNPLAAKLPDSGFRIVRSGGSRWLGLLMPFWYLGSLAALVAVAITSRAGLVTTAVALMVAVVVLTVSVLVPINNRVARWTTDADVDRTLTGRWDRYHWLRVAILAVIFALLAISAR
ncbi:MULTISPECIES: anthrone oxygenase family protein [unclassified Mycobacterium]|uniref:anthrone oxygenase family protein n=1 Tax=unclassified Mycobacterium TaxID=2642494 RepID=UPI0029C76C23|nr:MULTISPECIES: anthrone oxygenase family protein [unclassified Mycobacterium]